MRGCSGRDGEPPRVIDLLFHLPTGFVDRRNQPKLSEVRPDTVVTVAVTVERHRPPPPHRPRAPYNIDTFDDTNTLTITYFNARKDYLEKLLPKGELRYVSGTATLYDGHLQMLHPDRVVDAEGFARLPLIDPVYPLTEGLHPNQVRKAVELRSNASRNCRNGRTRPGLRATAIRISPGRCARSIAPRSPKRSIRQSAAWSRLAYDELLAGQLALACCARRCGSGPAAAAPPRAACAKRVDRGAALFADAVAAARGQRYRRRPGAAAPHAAAAARRRRLRQDRGRAARRRRRDRGRPSGGLDGADRNSGAPAFRDDRAARAPQPASASPS